MHSAIIIGSGPGGLECAWILARHGYRVTVLERGARPGGCMQTFRRGGCEFDTGFHYVGGLDEGESLHPLFKYFGLLDLPWRRLDDDCFDEIMIGDGTYPFASGHRRFEQSLSECFPREKAGIEAFTRELEEVGRHIHDPLKGLPASGLFSRSAYDFLCGCTADVRLRQVLSATSLKMQLDAETLPLYVFAQINNSFIQSAWRLEGGGGTLCRALADGIRAMGGELLTGRQVTAIEVDDEAVASRVRTSDGETFCADWIISSAHPAETLAMIGETPAVRKIYRRRISSLRSSFGMFTANIRLVPGMLQYFNRNLYIHQEEADLWHPDPSRTESVMVHCYIPEDGGGYADRIDLLSPMSCPPCGDWEMALPGRRGEDYEALKAQKLEECISLCERRLPGLRQAIDRVWTSTPLTYRSYTGTPGGSAYGIMKDWNNPLGTVISVRTPVRNLLLTGQSLNLHGILGTTMTAFLTCAEVVGREVLFNELELS